MNNAITIAVVLLLLAGLVLIIAMALYSFLDSRKTLQVGTHAKMRHARTTPAPLEDKEAEGGQQEVGTPLAANPRRNLIMGIVVAGALGTLFVKLWSMQVFGAGRYASLAEANYTSSFATRAPRGRILDCKGRVLVGNRATMAVICAADVADNRNVVHRLSNVLGIPKNAIKQRIENTSEGAQADRVVTSDAPMRAVSFILEHPQLFPGVSVEERTVRVYPYGTSAAHLLGYTGKISEEELANMTTADGYEYSSGDVVGKSGIEAQYESVLQGAKGTKTVEIDASGNVLQVLDEVASQPGADLVLTIDIDIQQAAERAILNAFERAKTFEFMHADAGAAIVLDLESNGVLALASYPTFSPKDLTVGISDDIWEQLSSQESNYPLANRAIAGQYPSGSTIKAFSSMAALRHGYADYSSSYYCTGVWTELGEQWAKKCWLETGHGGLDLIGGIAHSCDVVFYDLALDFYANKDNPTALQDEFVAWGLGSKTGVDLPNEKGGRIPTPEWKAEYNADTPETAQWNPGDTANIIIGQGDIVISPMQLAVAYSGIANNGTVYRPHVFDRVLGADGETVIQHDPEIYLQPEFAPEHLEMVQAGLIAQVQQNGNINDMPILTAGKTGTAQVTKKEDMGWYVGYGPVPDPKYLIVCMIEQGGSGGSICSPMFREIFDACMGIADDSIGEVSFDGSR